MKQNYSDGMQARIAHVRSHIDHGFEVDMLIRNIEHGLGSPPNCVLSLASYAEGKAMLAWFVDHDMVTMKKWCSTAASLIKKWHLMKAERSTPRSNMLHMLMPLLSDNEHVIAWYARYDEMFDMKRVENVKTADFGAYQVVLAVRGDWARLLARCDEVAAHPPGSASEKKYLLDHDFYRALAEKNVAGMESVLAQLVTPKAVRARNNDESGFTEDLISTSATIYAKIAWRHGFHVHVDSPYVPADFLPHAPLQEYTQPYTFLD